MRELSSEITEMKITGAHESRPAPADDPVPFIDLIRGLVQTSAEPEAWTIRLDDGTSPWIKVERGDRSLPTQGWKLHVSSTISDSPEVLRRAVPVLLAARVTFKVASSPTQLAALNQGNAGFSQIGKFLTVYPRNDDEAVDLAVTLDAATAGLTGPAVPSDRRLRPGSLVHYRYGGFVLRHTQTPLGRILPAIVAPDGAVIPDDRQRGFRIPAWADDPFRRAGVAIEPPPADADAPVIGGRYVILSTLHSSPRGAVYLAFDTEEPRACVLKHARSGGTGDRLGRDARDRLQREAAVLAGLVADPRFPRIHGLHELDGDLFLAMEDVAGKTLGKHVETITETGRMPMEEDVIRLGRELAGILGALHAAGLIFRDLKSTNIIVADDGHPRLIDFEMALDPLSSDRERFGFGTPGYMSPQQFAGAAPAVTDDVYALGAILYLLATGAEPSQAQGMSSLTSRPVRLLNPEIGPALAGVIERCLAPEAADRFPNMSDLSEALRQAGRGDRRQVAIAARGDTRDEQADRAHARALARRLGDTLCAVSHEAGDGSGRYWRSTHPQAAGFLSTDINTGSAGAVLALAEIVSELNDPTHRALLADGARWLLTAKRPEGALLPGLYVGEGSIGAAVLRAGQVLRDHSLIAAAAERGRRIATFPHRSPELFNGTAGRIRFHLWLYEETDDLSHLEDAIDGGDVLCSKAETGADGSISWTMPEGYDSLTGPLGTGYAHGIAGVADVLLDLYEVTGDERFRQVARGAALRLAQMAVPILDDGSGLGWPDREGQRAAAGFWCHGAPGIGRFLLHAAQLDLIPAAWELAIGAARTAATALRFGGPTQCHGLAGNIEALLDMYQATGGPHWLQSARELAVLLDAFATERDGHAMYCADTPNVYSPDYMIGYAGVAMALLRLANPEHLPHQLSRSGFRRKMETRPRAGAKADEIIA